eukprot:1926342-Prymnesium_polylepis.1
MAKAPAPKAAADAAAVPGGAPPPLGRAALCLVIYAIAGLYAGQSPWESFASLVLFDVYGLAASQTALVWL